MPSRHPERALAAVPIGATTPTPTITPTLIPNPSELSQDLITYGAKNAIVKQASGVLTYDYIVPSGPYDQLFDWDMYFMGVALSYDHVGAPVESSVKDFLLWVDANANYPGYAPREIATTGPWALPQQCKPFMAQAAVRASNTLQDFTWLKQAAPESSTQKTYYDKLKMMLAFWEANRKGANGLFFWDNGLESGVDNNPAVSTDPSLTTEGVDLQVYIYREYLALSTIAGKLGNVPDETLYTQKAKSLSQLILQLMWSDSDDMFYDVNSRTGKQIQIKTWVNFLPLWAKIAPNGIAKRMIEHHLLSPAEFWSAHGVRTLSATEKLYNPSSGYWQGPIWVLPNYLLMHGLLNYGYKTEALDLAQKTVALLVNDYRLNKSMNECYNPETGVATAGGNFVSWNLLAEHMIEEAQSGADPTSW
jgi:neutral trehalase